MQRKPLNLSEATDGLDVLATADLSRHIEDWLLDSQMRQHSEKTLTIRRDFMGKLLSFLMHTEKERVGAAELRAFMIHLNEGHKQPNGRFNNPKLTTPLKPVSIHGYYRVLRGFFNWLVEDGVLPESPMRRIKPPVVRLEQKQPISNEHVNALLQAARQTTQAKRDEALLLMLLDTGLRASEACNLKIQDIDLASRSFKVNGKGNKVRAAYFGRATAKALAAYIRSRRAKQDAPLFASRTNGFLNANSLRQLVERLALAADIPDNQISPHALRRTFAVSILRNGGNVFALQAMLGHSDIQMTKRYCAVADADLQETHARCSPADSLKR